MWYVDLQNTEGPTNKLNLKPTGFFTHKEKLGRFVTYLLFIVVRRFSP